MNEFAQFPLIPLLTLESPQEAEFVGEILHDLSIFTLEIALRTPHALKCLSVLCKTYPQMQIGAGTVRTTTQAKAAYDVGATFFMSPGFSPNLGEFMLKNNLKWFPGVDCTFALEVALAQGWSTLKLFPAQALGGPLYIKALEAPYPEVKWIATGGIDRNNLTSYLSLPSVTALGLTALVPRDLIQQRNSKALFHHIQSYIDLIQSPTRNKENLL